MDPSGEPAPDEGACFKCTNTLVHFLHDVNAAGLAGEEMQQ
jgi:hypothetical protein